MQTEANFELGLVLNDQKAVEEDGDLYIEGYASDFGVDREDEAFEPGAFDEAMKAYMASNPVLLWQHSRKGEALGQVVGYEHRTDGLWVKARIDKPTQGSWAEDIFAKIKRGTIKGFSVGGRFFRRMTDAGPRIYKTDINEISVTPLPVNPRTLFAVAGKAFGTTDEREEELFDRFESVLVKLRDAFDAAEGKAAGKTDKPWDGSSSRFSDEQWRRSCVLDRGPEHGGKGRYGLPVREPDGTLNCKAVANAKARIGQVSGASSEAKSKARAKLDSLSKRCQSDDG